MRLNIGWVVGVWLGGISAVQAQIPEAGVEDFLADRSRAGTLVGAIIGGAATAHPVGLLLGSIGGYLVGKSSQYQRQPEPIAPPSYQEKGLLTPANRSSPYEGGNAEQRLSINENHCFGNGAKGMIASTQSTPAERSRFVRLIDDGEVTEAVPLASRVGRARCFYLME